MKIVAVANQKGGVGKTTTSVNLAASLAAMGRRVLLVDMDPQGNATMSSGVDKHEAAMTAYDLLVDQVPLAEVMVPAADNGYSLVPANRDLTAAEIELLDVEKRERRLADALAAGFQFDLIIIDCPPSLSMLTINALVAAQSVIVTMQCEYFALEGLSALLNTIRRIADTVNPQLKIEGILRTMYDPRNSLTGEVSSQLHKHFGELVYRTVIPRNVRLAEAPSHGLPALQYDRYSSGARAYAALAGEFVKKQNQTAS
ncbi:MAG: AAA family ATPase [Luminiphilus sp.]|nr:AAA family ATPase [Luminiphilus sp.]